MVQKQSMLNTGSLTLLQRINERFSLRQITPVAELVDYATQCDKFAAAEISADQLQVALCEYLDKMALRARSLSEALGRIKEPPLSEVVTESLNMLIDAVVRTDSLKGQQFSICSEKNVRLPSGGYRKPDVGIWKHDKLMVVVECKTSLGHKRKEWLKEYDQRVEEFKTINVPPESLLLFVGSEQTWKGFSRVDPRFMTQWFALAPVGAWHGGGKSGEVPLSVKNHKGTVQIFVETLKKRLLSISDQS